MEEELEVEATELFINDWVRTWKVGFNIFQTLPVDTIKRRGVIGALAIKNSKEIAKYYGLSIEEGCVVIGVIDSFVANVAGVKPGDVIKEINGKKIKELDQIKFESGKDTKIVIERGGANQQLAVKPIEMSYIRINTIASGVVNAYAKINKIEFTTGMVHFFKNDDELAIVMGHELAHLISNHISESISVGALYGIAGLLTGPFAPLTFKSLYAPYSRDNEREADYLGLIYANKAGYDIGKGVDLWKRFALEMPKSRSKSFFRSHPPSPERILRVKKVIEMIK